MTNRHAEEIIPGDFNLESHQPEMQKRTVLQGNRSLSYVAEPEAKRPDYERYRILYNPALQPRRTVATVTPKASGAVRDLFSTKPS